MCACICLHILSLKPSSAWCCVTNIYVVLLAYCLSLHVCVRFVQKTAASSLALKSTVVFRAYCLIGQKGLTKWRSIEWDENKHILNLIAHEFLVHVNAHSKTRFSAICFNFRGKCREIKRIFGMVNGFKHGHQLKEIAFDKQIIYQSVLQWCAILHLFFNHTPVGWVTTPSRLPVSIKLS